MLLIHQMTKVASRSWVELASLAADSEEGQPLHCHYVLPTNRQRIAAAFAAPPIRQTIANMLLPHNLLRVGARVWERIEAAQEGGQQIRVITGMRDPVSRSISLLVFMADFYGHISHPLNPRSEISPEHAIDALRQNWHAVLDDREPAGTFEWLFWYLTRAYRTWFGEEFEAAFGIDVLAHGSKAHEGAQRLTTDSMDILLYRIEDMRPVGPRYAGLLSQASEFLGTPVAGFPSINTGCTRRSHVASAVIRRGFRLPTRMLDAIYDDPVVRNFYTGAEIAAFKVAWRESPQRR